MHSKSLSIPYVLAFLFLNSAHALALGCTEAEGFFHYHQHGFVKDDTGELVLFSGPSYDENGVETQVVDQPIGQGYSIHLDVPCEGNPNLTIVDGYFGKTFAEFAIENLRVSQAFSGQAVQGETVRGIVTEESVDGMRYLALRLESDTIGNVSFTGSRFSVIENPSCSTRHGDGGFEDAYIILPSNAPGADASLQALVEKNGWQFIYEDGSLGDRQPTEGHCTYAICGTPILVGYGNEFLAVAEIERETGICAQRVSAPAGAPPLQIAGIPFSIFRDKSGTELNAIVQEKVVDIAFNASRSLKISPLSRVGVGRSFQVRVLGYGPDLELTFGEGYWYQGVIQLDIGTNVHGGTVSDTIQLTILDLIEIAAPATISELPEELIRDGRRLDFYDPVSGAQTEDTEKFEALASSLVSKIAGATGGKIITPWY